MKRFLNVRGHMQTEVVRGFWM